jgi:FkbM family methyltransferase
MIAKLRATLGFVGFVRNWSDHYLATYGSARPALLTYHLRNGLRLAARPRTLDVAALKDVFYHRVYSPPGFEVEENSIVLDIGAHIGAFAASAARAAPGVTVFAFEPAPDNFALLSRNMVQNGLLSSVKLRQSAVSGAGGPRQLHLWGSPAEYSLHIVRPGSEQLPVPSVTLADILDEHALGTVDLLKMDCEGAEYEILGAAGGEVLGRVRRIAMEAHLLDSSRTPRLLVAFLETQGFVVRTGHEGDVTAMIWASRPARPRTPGWASTRA